MRQILSQEELIGKIIKNIFDDEERYLYFVFDDDTFCIFSEHSYSEDHAPPELDGSKINLVPNLNSYNNNDRILIKLGVYTEEERQAEIRKRNAEREEYERVEKIKRDAGNAKKELATYKRLKAKYEK